MEKEKIKLSKQQFYAIGERIQELRGKYYEEVKKLAEIKGENSDKSSPEIILQLDIVTALKRSLNHYKEMLDNSELYSENDQNDTVEIGSNVSLKIEEELLNFTLAGSIAGISLEELATTISVESPLGEAVYHKKVGDSVTVKLPEGQKSGTIIDIQRNHENNFAR